MKVVNVVLEINFKPDPMGNDAILYYIRTKGFFKIYFNNIIYLIEISNILFYIRIHYKEI